MRSRPARDAIQFTLDVDALESTVVKNKSKAEMDADKRLRKKRTLNETTGIKVPESTDLNKKRKLSDVMSSAVEDKIKPEAKEAKDSNAEDKPWEGKPEEEEDYRWNVCENCQ